MTFAVGHVEGGTRAGWRRVKQKPPVWFCHCGIVDTPGSRVYRSTGTTVMRKRPSHLVRCPDCKAERDAVAS